MNATIRPSDSATTSSWRLWIDRCGGFGLVIGDSVRIGACHPGGSADVRVRADWRRQEGTLLRRGGDYFWRAASAAQRGADGTLLRSGECLPIPGSAQLRLTTPTPLSASAVLSLAPPHRFDGHVDAVILVDRTVLIGPQSGHHICCGGLDSSVVLRIREGRFQAKLQSDPQTPNAADRSFCDLEPGRRVTLGDLDLTLERT
jgi:hypothetical protein